MFSWFRIVRGEKNEHDHALFFSFLNRYALFIQGPIRFKHNLQSWFANDNLVEYIDFPDDTDIHFS